MIHTWFIYDTYMNAHNSFNIRDPHIFDSFPSSIMVESYALESRSLKSAVHVSVSTPISLYM